jgi:hypothetical protein
MGQPDLNVRTYDPKKVIITFGSIILTGVMDGTFITVTQNGDSFEKLKGADGGVDRVNKNANDYSVAITLKQTSPSNDALSSAHIADKLSNTGKQPLTIKDVNGTSLFFARQAWVAKEPDPEYSDSISGREWRLDTGVAEQFIGGNLL